MGKMLVISFKDDNDEKVFHEVVNLLEQYEFQPTEEIKYQCDSNGTRIRLSL